MHGDVLDVIYDAGIVENPLLQNSDGGSIPSFTAFIDLNLQPTPDRIEEASGNSINLFFNGPGLKVPETANAEVALETLASELTIFKDSHSSVEIANAILGVTEIGDDYIKLDLDLTAIYNSGISNGDDIYLSFSVQVMFLKVWMVLMSMNFLNLFLLV